MGAAVLCSRIGVAKARYEASCFREKRHGTLANGVGKQTNDKDPLEPGASASAQNMKKKDMVNLVERAACSGISNEWKTAMSKPIKEMTPVSSIYDIDFRNLAQEHQL